MNVLFVSPGYPPFYKHYCIELKRAGATVLGVGDIPIEGLDEDLREALDDYAFVPELHDERHLLETVTALVRRHGSLGWLESHNEHWLESDARLRAALGVPGPLPDEALRFRSKVVQKHVVAAHALPHAPGEALTSAGHLRAFASRHGFPVVVKPERGVGSRDTFMARTPEQLERLAQQPLAGSLVEVGLSGDIVSFDGLVDAAGAVMFCTSLRYGSQVLGLSNRWQPTGHLLTRAMAPDLERLGRRTLAAFGLRQRFFHIEYFRDDAGALTFLELNARLPGCYSTDMIDYACDISVYRLWAQLIVHGAGLPGYERRYNVAHALRSDRWRYALDHAALVARLGPSLAMHTRVPASYRWGDVDEVYLVRHPDLDQTQALMGLVEGGAP